MKRFSSYISKNLISISVHVLALLLSVACGKGADSASSANALAQAMPGVGVSSPTTSSDTTATGVALRAEQAPVDGTPTTSASPSPSPSPQGDISSQISANQQYLNQDPKTGGAKLTFEPPPPSIVDCYGPSFTFTPEGGSPVSHPSGDLGLFSATEPPQNGQQACSAAEINALIGLMDPFNTVVKAVGVMLSAGNGAGLKLPALGQTIDITSSMPQLGGLTVSQATLTYVANDPNGNPIYKTELTIEKKDGEVQLVIEHTPANADNTAFSGNIQGVFPYTDSQGNKGLYSAIAMTYVTDGKTLSYIAEMAGNRTTSSNDFFGKNGLIDFTKPAFGENGYTMLARFDLGTKEGTLRLAWQAGSMDGATRVFEAQTAATTGLLAGYSYFGFGNEMQSLNLSASEWLVNFFPDWVEGLTLSPSLTQVQGQTFAQSEVGGVFVSTAFHGAFVPTATGTGTGAITGNTNFNNPSYTVTTLDFVTPGSLGAIATVTIPSYQVQ